MAFAQQRLGQANETPRIIQALADRGLRKQAQEYLVELGPPVAADVAASLSTAAPEVRVILLQVLGMNGGPKEAGAVDALQSDGDPRVAAAAQQALSRIRRTRG